jgi:hypothetical protein
MQKTGVAIPKARSSVSNAQDLLSGSGSAPQRLPAPAFGSSPNLQALALDAAAEPSLEARTFQEITVVSADQPKLLSRLSEVMVRCLLTPINICHVADLAGISRASFRV